MEKVRQSVDFTEDNASSRQNLEWVCLIFIFCRCNKNNINMDTFTMLLEENIQNGNYTVRLTPYEIKFVETLMQEHPLMLCKIHNALKEIVKNEKIDVYDIPHIILIIQEIVKNHMITSAVKNVCIFNVLKYIVDALLESRILPFPKMEINILKRVADTSLELLNTNIQENVNGNNCFSC